MNLNEDTYNEVTAQPGKKVIQFTASWCGPCKFLTPRLQDLSEKYGFDYFKVDVDSNTELARQFHIMSVPTVLVYDNGKMTNVFVGIKPEAQLKSELGLTD